MTDKLSPTVTDAMIEAGAAAFQEAHEQRYPFDVRLRMAYLAMNALSESDDAMSKALGMEDVLPSLDRLCRSASASGNSGAVSDDFYAKHFFVATVSEDGREIGLDHPTDADWERVRQAHVALRDRLNERLAEEDRCPINPLNERSGRD